MVARVQGAFYISGCIVVVYLVFLFCKRKINQKLKMLEGKGGANGEEPQIDIQIEIG